MNSTEIFSLPKGRLVVGIVSPGKVGLSFAHALSLAGHVVSFTYGHSMASRLRSEKFLPEAQIVDLAQLIAFSELIILAVPDPVLVQIIDSIAVHTKPSSIVVHTSAAYGLEVLEPLAYRGVRTLAVHPIISFSENIEWEAHNFERSFFVVTAHNTVDCAIGQTLVLELGGTPIVVSDQYRDSFFTSLKHANVTINKIAQQVIDAFTNAIDEEQLGIDDPRSLAKTVLEPIFYDGIRSALDNISHKPLTYPQHKKISWDFPEKN